MKVQGRYSDFWFRCGSGDPGRTGRPCQAGQAALEALVCMLALAVLWAGVAWLGRIQDVALHASHAARYSAFMATRQDTQTPDAGIRAAMFEGPGNQWSDRHGQALQHSVYQDIDVRFVRNSPLALHHQIGGADTRMTQLRHDWHTADHGVLSAHVSLIPRNALPIGADGSHLLKLYQFDGAYPLIHRHISVLTGSGHASDDASAADRVASSELAWSSPTGRSYRLGRRVASVASKVDGGWDRPAPVFDWLQPWADLLPHHHLHPLP